MNPVSVALLSAAVWVLSGLVTTRLARRADVGRLTSRPSQRIARALVRLAGAKR